MTDLEGLPGAELVLRGLADLRGGRASMEALLVEVGATRLRRCGIDVPDPPPVQVGFPEHRLYEMLRRESPRGAHGRYNALIRRLVSFEHALEHRVARARRRSRPVEP